MLACEFSNYWKIYLMFTGPLLLFRIVAAIVGGHFLFMIAGAATSSSTILMKGIVESTEIFLDEHEICIGRIYSSWVFL